MPVVPSGRPARPSGRQQGPGYLEAMNARILAGRAIRGKLAATLVWLASSAGGYVTGQTIAVDGGFTIT